MSMSDRWQDADSPYAIPARYRTKCENQNCQRIIDIRVDDGSVCQFTSGWVMQRSGGGGHGVMMPKRENRWMHRECVERLVQGGDQQRLFG